MMSREHSISLLTKFCENDKDRLALLEESINNGNVIVDDKGDISWSETYLLADKELQYKTMSSERMKLEIIIRIINLINNQTDCKVDQDDIVVKNLTKLVIENIIRAISNNTTVDYWKSTELN